MVVVTGTVERDRPWLIRTYSGHSSARASNELYRNNLAKGQTGLSVAFDLPTQTGYDPDDRARAGRGRQGRRAGPAPRRDAHAVRRHPARRDEHVDDDQRDRDVAARHVPRARRRAGHPVREALGHDAERHPEGVPLARHLHLPARGVEAAHRRPHRVHGEARSRVEPDQRVPVPLAGSGRDAGAGARVRTRQRDRGARRGARLRPGSAGRVRRGRRAARRSSSTRACASSKRCARCARSPRCGTASAQSATASPTRSCAASATACR